MCMNCAREWRELRIIDWFMSPPCSLGVSLWVHPGLDSSLLIEERVEGSNTSKLALQVTWFKIVKAQSGSSCVIPRAEETLLSRMWWEWCLHAVWHSTVCKWMSFCAWHAVSWKLPSRHLGPVSSASLFVFLIYGVSVLPQPLQLAAADGLPSRVIPMTSPA